MFGLTPTKPSASGLIARAISALPNCRQDNECLGPLQKGPFYAVKVYAGDIGTACGIRCNENAQALDAEGQPIAGLYAAGNDMQSVMGGQYPAPGITLGPALTFGWIAGQHVARAATQPQAEMEIA